MKPHQRFSIFSIFVSLSLPLAAQSTWTGSSSSDWSTATNWNPGIPAEASNIIISDTTANGLNLNDGSHTVGSITVGTTGTRTSGFSLNTTIPNTLTIEGGVIATGNFTGGIGMRIRGNIKLPVNQTWQIGGSAGDHAADRGIAINEMASSGVAGSLMLDGDLLKSGSGQLTLGAINVTGNGNIYVNEGSLKLNAGGSLPLTIGTVGSGKIITNNSATLILSQNSGSFAVSRPIQMNNTSGIVTGSGSNNKSGTFEIASNMEWNGIHTITNNKDTNNSANGFVNYRFTGVMSGAGTITKTGPSQLILAGSTANTLGGQVTVAGGELMLDKTGAIAVPGNILVTGGILRINQTDQIVHTSNITLTGGKIAFTSNRSQTIASLTISSGETSSLSGLNVTGATTISNGIQELNSGQTFTTHSLSIINGATIRPVGNATAPESTTIQVGGGGLKLDSGKIVFGNVGNNSTNQLLLGGDLISTGTSSVTANTYSGPRVIDLQAATRSFDIQDGVLTIAAELHNGTAVKSGLGSLVLSRSGSTANFSFDEGPVQILGEVDAGNIVLSGSALLMNIDGASPSQIRTSGNFTATGGSIDISLIQAAVSAGTQDLVVYGGTLTGNPTVNIPAELAASRLNPVVSYGSGSNSAISLSTTAVPLDLTWKGGGGGVWDNNNTAAFGTEKFYPLDSVTFDDSGTNPTVTLNSVVFPSNVVFNHGGAVPTYTVTGTGGIDGPTNLTKEGTGTTILATNNTYTGTTEILSGVLRIGKGGTDGSLGTGAVVVDSPATLQFARSGTAIVPNVISGAGAFIASGPGTVVLTANSPSFTGTIDVTGGTLQFGNGEANGSLGTIETIDVGAGAIFAIKRTGTPVIAHQVTGAGSLSIIGGSPILTGYNDHRGGTSITEDGFARIPSDTALGEIPFAMTPNAIRLNHGGLKNEDSFTTIDLYRGITITGEAYFTAGWSKSLTISGPITGNGDIFINYDSGTVVFNDPTSNWNGVLTLGATKPGATGTTGGQLEISSINNAGQPGPLGSASADPANLVFNGGRLIYMGTSGSTNRGFTLEGAGTIDVSFDTLTMSGKATGPGSLTKVGSGTLVLSGNSDFAGNVTVDNGVLHLTHSNALGAGEKTLIIAGDASKTRIPEVRLSGNISLNVQDVQISGAGVANLTGALHNLSGNNTVNVSGQVTMRTGNGDTTLYAESGTLTLNAPLITANASNRTLNLGGAGNGVINGVIANGSTANLPIIKAGSGTWTLNGASTYTGATTVNEGVLALQQPALANASPLAIAVGARVALNFDGTDEVGSLVLDGVAQPDGIYDAASNPEFFSGSGSIRVGPGEGGPGYSSWAANFPFVAGVNDGPLDDPDADGIPNLLEYVFGGVPVGPGSGDPSILPSQELTATSLVMTFERSDRSQADVALTVQWSADLKTWNDFAAIGPVDSLPAVKIIKDSPTEDLDTVVVTIPRSLVAGGKLFARLKAMK